MSWIRDLQKTVEKLLSDLYNGAFCKSNYNIMLNIELYLLICGGQFGGEFLSELVQLLL